MPEIVDTVPIGMNDLLHFKAEVYDLPSDVNLREVLGILWKDSRRKSADLRKCADVLRAKEMPWKNWVSINMPNTYSKTLLLAWDRWNE
eukprot:15453983-Alexandrium_andersonii.AAC.1